MSVTTMPEADVTGDLNAFKEASRCGATGLSWSRSDTSASGIVVTDIDSTHPSEQWDLFRSSRPGVIAHETLRLAHTPEYKAQREETPEDIKLSVPVIKQVLEAMHIPILQVDGFEADDSIGYPCCSGLIDFGCGKC